MDDTNEKIPTPREIKQELNEYLTKKYGNRIRLSFAPSIVTQPDSDGISEGEVQKKSVSPEIDFDIKPEELEAYLNEYVIRQDRAKEILATKICTHFNRIKFIERYKRFAGDHQVGSIKNNIIMIGPTGVGKTYLIKLIARKIGVPFVKGDATKFSETGYVGGDVEDLVRDLVQEADGDIERAQYGIIYLDEIDKIASSNNLVGPDVSRTGVQRALLKPMEDTDVDLKVPHDIIAQMEAVEQYRKTGKREKRKVNTKNILFIMSGAFSGLEEIIRKRLYQQGLGFGADIRSRSDEENILAQVKAEDLINYGFESEFIGRLPVIAVFERLDCSDLFHILKNANNPVILGKKRDFLSYGIDVKFEDAALRKIAATAFQEKTGARGLVSALERVTIPFEKRLPSTPVKRFVVTGSMVDAPELALRQLLKNPDDEAMEVLYERIASVEAELLMDSLKKREEELAGPSGIRFGDEILDVIISWVIDEGISIPTAYEEASRLRKIVGEFEEYFAEAYQVTVRFADDAQAEIFDRAVRDNADVWTTCEAAVHNYEYGLRLIYERTGRKEFMVRRSALIDSEEYLNTLIRESYDLAAEPELKQQ
ncbi:MAG TPA: AAA family ATPase [Thermodesulfobacteriota bacterium]|nr:AAA family ATPase [Deltaproteobacteria bacterium]HNR12706.1 AAA family ATPase [Thermodesulfobacteriota bacterium]HNU72973.1 AAA family ATPase [Thermodesulfobacteriota bacterium]HOC38737.1 AAA family ATPase [Thermodesulfobacteriota bacterium]